jgi:uncharacterized protein DUF6912
MWLVRIYLAATLPGLATAGVATSAVPSQVEVAPAGSRACAVTPALREWYREGDIEELEYAALTRAAVGSLRLLAASGVTPAAGPLAPSALAARALAGSALGPTAAAPRRVVLAADVADDAVVLDPDSDPAAVLVMDAVLFDQVICAHVDDPSAAPDVAAAARLVEAADGGDDDAQFAIDGLGDHELQWYAVQEIPFLLQ